MCRSEVKYPTDSPHILTPYKRLHIFTNWKKKCASIKGARCGCEADGGPVFLIITTMTETTAAAVVMAEGCRFISGHRGFMISVAGQAGP